MRGKSKVHYPKRVLRRLWIICCTNALDRQSEQNSVYYELSCFLNKANTDWCIKYLASIFLLQNGFQRNFQEIILEYTGYVWNRLDSKWPLHHFDCFIQTQKYAKQKHLDRDLNMIIQFYPPIFWHLLKEAGIRKSVARLKNYQYYNNIILLYSFRVSVIYVYLKAKIYKSLSWHLILQPHSPPWGCAP